MLKLVSRPAPESLLIPVFLSIEKNLSLEIFLLQKLLNFYEDVLPLRGVYQLKEISPVEWRLLLQLEFDADVLQKCQQIQCHVRIPFHHRGAIRSNTLRCSPGSNFTIEDRGRVVVWQIRRLETVLESNLVGELTFISPDIVPSNLTDELIDDDTTYGPLSIDDIYAPSPSGPTNFISDPHNNQLKYYVFKLFFL